MHTCASSIGPLDGNLVLRALKHSATQLPRGGDSAPRIRINKLPDLYNVPDPRAAFPSAKACAPEGSIRSRVASNVAARRRRPPSSVLCHLFSVLRSLVCPPVCPSIRPTRMKNFIARLFTWKISRPASGNRSRFSDCKLAEPRTRVRHRVKSP